MVEPMVREVAYQEVAMVEVPNRVLVVEDLVGMVVALLQVSMEEMCMRREV